MNKKYLHLLMLMLIYLIGYVLCKFYFAEGMPMESYTAGWLFRRSFIFTWVIGILFFVFNKPITATFITIGCFLGIVIGDVLGGWIRSVGIEEIEALIKSGIEVSQEVKAQAYHHYGILPIWFIVFFLFLIIGLVLDKMKTKKA